jgi:hypothetical protein
MMNRRYPLRPTTKKSFIHFSTYFLIANRIGNENEKFHRWKKITNYFQVLSIDVLKVYGDFHLIVCQTGVEIQTKSFNGMKIQS